MPDGIDPWLTDVKRQFFLREGNLRDHIAIKNAFERPEGFHKDIDADGHQAKKQNSNTG
ncbi:hypothetical protein [Mucilaginibacter sp.]|uniref:hypothetical protein n=1 Tax=Mucilaginibacter sp. TaxID=1882438 RepID=UPI0035BC63D2